MYSAERMSQTGQERPIPDIPEDEGEIALALVQSQNQMTNALHPTVDDGRSRTDITGASGGSMYRSNVTGVHNGDVVTLHVQNGYTPEDLKATMKIFTEGLWAQMETAISSLRTSQPLQNSAPVSIKTQDSESGDATRDEPIMGGVQAEDEEVHEITDDELCVLLHQCDMGDVSEEDILSLTDEEVYDHVLNMLTCCNIRTSDEAYGSDTFGIKMRVKPRQQEHKKENPLSAKTEETISDVKLKYNVKGGNRSDNPGTDLLKGVNPETPMEDCSTAEGGQHQLKHVRSEKLADDSSSRNTVCAESLSVGCWKEDNANIKGNLLLPSPVDPPIGLPGSCVEFTFDLRCIQPKQVRVITRHNVEKTVEIGKLHPPENVEEVFTFLDAILKELGPQSEIRFQSCFYAGYPESVSELIRIDLRDIQNIIVRLKTKLNVELILQISAMKPPTASFRRIDTFLSDMLLKDC